MTQPLTITLDLRPPKLKIGDRCKILQPVKPDVYDMFQAGLIGVVKAVRCTIHYAVTEKGSVSSHTEYNYSLDVINMHSASPDLVMCVFSIYESRLESLDESDQAQAA